MSVGQVLLSPSDLGNSMKTASGGNAWLAFPLRTDILNGNVDSSELFLLSLRVVLALGCMVEQSVSGVVDDAWHDA